MTRPGDSAADPRRDDVRLDAPTALRVAIVATVLEALAVLALAVATVVQAVRGDRSSVSDAALLAVLLLVWSAGLFVAALGLRARRRWARAPVVLSQLLLLVIGIPVAQNSSSWWAGLAVVVVSVAGLVSVLTRRVTVALGDEHGPADRPG